MQGEPSGTNSLYAESLHRSVGVMEIEKTARRRIASGTRSVRSISPSAMWTPRHAGRSRRIPLLRDARIAVLQFERRRWVYARHYLEDVFDMAVGFLIALEKSWPWKSNSNGRWYPEHERFFEANYVLIRNGAASSFRVRECTLGAGNALVASHR